MCQVEGTVTDATGKPLAAVRIELRRTAGGQKREARTDRSGRWSVQGLAEGDWELVFRKEGYLDKTLTRTIYPAKKRNRIRLGLKKGPFDPGLADAEVAAPAAVPRPAPVVPEGADPLQAAQALSAQGEHAAALELYLALLRARPDHEELHLPIGNAYLQLGAYDEALEHFQIAFSRDPESAPALSSLAEVYLKRRDIESALVYLGKLLERSPNHPTANYNMAEILLSSDEPEAAIGHYEAAIVGRPDWALAYLRLGFASLSVGQSGKALAAFEQYLALEPDGAEAVFVRDTIQMLK
jgi:tetratricopeptide (TPR) repeat protein